MNGEELKQVLDFSVTPERKELSVRVTAAKVSWVTMKVKYGILLSSVAPEYQSAPF